MTVGKSSSSSPGFGSGGSVPPLPGWIGLLAVVAIVAIVGLMLVPRTPLQTEQKYVSDQQNPAGSNPTLPSPPATPPPVYPSNLFQVTLSPSEPRAGDNVTITASLHPAYASMDWKKNFAFEIWSRQFGNWKIKSCYETPCSYTYNQVSQGTLEYLVKRLMVSGDIVSEPASGAYAVNVVSTVQTGDTIAPNIVMFHNPTYPRVGDAVTITASVNDISSVDGVRMFVDDQLVTTCPQKVKIAQCAYTTSSLPAGVHTYYASAADTYGNAGSSSPQEFIVQP